MTERDPAAVAAAVDAAAEELYGAPLSAFTAERKRLADALRATGAKPAAAAVAKLPRPAMSAWVVNRLYREARDDLDALLAAGARLRTGDRAALDAQRTALARLRARAAEVLAGDGHAASPATLQRVATTLQALSATGGFAPDPPGRLLTDRDPPGFEAIVAVPPGPPLPPRPAPVAPAATAAGAPAAVAPAESAAARAAREQAEAEERARLEQLERERLEREQAAERARRERERAAIEQTVRQRTAEVDALRKNLDAAIAVVDNLRERLRTAETALTDARARAAALAPASND
ncbi:MAG TPA: hypothetical protein VM734_27665 [Kofleriaceae bacterium]|nr:hypothetical protein [Kofleriaceae bacterium]